MLIMTNSDVWNRTTLGNHYRPSLRAIYLVLLSAKNHEKICRLEADYSDQRSRTFEYHYRSRSHDLECQTKKLIALLTISNSRAWNRTSAITIPDGYFSLYSKKIMQWNILYYINNYKPQKFFYQDNRIFDIFLLCSF